MTRFTAPETNTYNFTCEHDDGCIVIINGTTLIRRWSHGVFTTSATIDLVQGELYELILEWDQGGGGWHYRLYWQYGSNAQELIQLEPNWYNYEHTITTSPITVNVLPPL